MSKKEENEQKYFTQSELLEQGWTKGLIVKFFSEPDARRTNPRYRSAAPVKLYSIEKVNAVIQTEEYNLARAKVEKRKLAAKKAADSKRENSLKECENAKRRLSHRSDFAPAKEGVREQQYKYKLCITQTLTNCTYSAWTFSGFLDWSARQQKTEAGCKMGCSNLCTRTTRNRYNYRIHCKVRQLNNL